jgi:hypothetical protein
LKPAGIRGFKAYRSGVSIAGLASSRRQGGEVETTLDPAVIGPGSARSASFDF